MSIRTCNKCGQEKNLTEFHFLSGSRSQRTKMCKSCKQETAKSQYWKKKQEDPHYSKRRWIKNAYGLTWEQYGQMKAAGCSICGTTDATTWEVDHDHRCCNGRTTCGKCIRGLLCHDCNQMLGKARDSSALLQKAITYLAKWDEVHGPTLSGIQPVSS